MMIFLIPMVCSFAFTFGLAYLRSTERNKENISKAQPLTSQNCIILFDLHGVLFKHDYKKMIYTFWESPRKWKLLRDMLNPHLIWDIIKLLYRRPVPESFFMHLAHNYKQVKDVLPLLIRIANCQKVNHPVIKLVRTLKDNGYQLAILSNIGQRIFNDLEPFHHDIFHLFDHIMVATPETHYASKPNPKIFERFMQSIDTGRTVIMIDDKEKNLCGALPFGIIGIKYNNVRDLKQMLKKIGIIVQKQ